jgi:hypothetical protein
MIREQCFGGMQKKRVRVGGGYTGPEREVAAVHNAYLLVYNRKDKAAMEVSLR